MNPVDMFATWYSTRWFTGAGFQVSLKTSIETIEHTIYLE